MMPVARIYFVAGEDGGVGKSTYCSVLAEYLLSKELKFILVDADRTKQDVTEKYQKKIECLTSFFSESNKLETEANIIYDLAVEEEYNVLVNLPAQVHHLLAHWIKENNILDLAESDRIEICYFHLSNGKIENLKSFDLALELFGERTRFFFVKNLHHCEDWECLNQKHLLDKLSTLAVKIIKLPRLQSKFKEAIDSNKLTWLDAQSHDDSQIGFRKVARNNVKLFLREIYEQLDTLSITQCQTPENNSIASKTPTPTPTDSNNSTASKTPTPTLTDSNNSTVATTLKPKPTQLLQQKPIPLANKKEV